MEGRRSLGRSLLLGNPTVASTVLWLSFLSSYSHLAPRLAPGPWLLAGPEQRMGILKTSISLLVCRSRPGRVQCLLATPAWMKVSPADTRCLEGWSQVGLDKQQKVMGIKGLYTGYGLLPWELKKRCCLTLACPFTSVVDLSPSFMNKFPIGNKFSKGPCEA